MFPRTPKTPVLLERHPIRQKLAPFQDEERGYGEPDYPAQHTETIWRVVLDLISLCILLAAAIVLHYIATPFSRGFFCSDTTIKFPYKSDTVSFYIDVGVSVAVPIVVMWATECCKRIYFYLYKKALFQIRLFICSDKGRRIDPVLRNIYILTVVFGYGYLATWVLTEVAKNFVGELRPHFLAVCQPSFNCSGVTTQNAFNTYLQPNIDYTCLNSDSEAVREARRSFFSGHTSSIFFGFAWLIMYLHVAWSWRHLGILAHLLQAILAAFACYVGYTRLTDFHHHWHDVLLGALVGSLVAFVSFKFILNWRRSIPRFLPYTIGNTALKRPVVRTVVRDTEFYDQSYERDRF